MIEFTLVGIPMIFVLISIFELARGMWVYHTLAYAVKEGTRFAIVKGRDYVDSSDAPVSATALVQYIKAAGVGLTEPDFTLTLRAGSSVAVTCTPNPAPVCDGGAGQWPPPSFNNPGIEVSIEASYPFRSALAMFWPGGGPGMTFGMKRFRAFSSERIQF